MLQTDGSVIDIANCFVRGFLSLYNMVSCRLFAP